MQTPSTEPLLVMGLGLMGLPIAQRLHSMGFSVAGWNRGEARARLAAGQGLEVAHDLTEGVQKASLLLLTLSDAGAIRETLGSLDLTHKTVLQMGTISPDQSRSLAAHVIDAGGEYLEAPVLGSIPEARAGRLIIMAGGEEALFQRIMPLLSCLGEAPLRVGAVGQGAALKLAMNQLIASLTSGFSLSLSLVRSEGLDVDAFMSLLRQSALYAPTFDKKLDKMLSHDYANPNFPLKHLIKDVALFLAVAEHKGINSALPRTLLELLERAGDEGHADSDYSALYEAIDRVEKPEP